VTLSNCCLLYKVQLQHVGATFGKLSDIKVSLQNSAKIIKFGWHLANLLHTVKRPFLKHNVNTGK